MILSVPSKDDFTFDKDLQVDTENRGFTTQEMAKLAGPSDREGAKGVEDLWSQAWGQGRTVPPEIQHLKSDFGYQTRPILTDLIEVAGYQKTELDGIIKARSSRYNFYIMSCGVYISPNDDERFEALKFEVYYKDNGASTYSMLPGPHADKIFGISGKADIGVTGKIDFDLPPIPLQGVTIDAAAKAELEARFIVAFEYELKTQVVDAFGVGNSFCKWFMYKGDKLRNDVVFYPIIMTPKTLKLFDVEFRAYFKISHPGWKHSELFLKQPMTVPVTV